MIFTSCDCRYGCENGVCQKRECKCDVYWEGDACQRRELSKYTGTYIGSNSCEVDQMEFTLQNGQSVDEMLWNNNLVFTYRDSALFDILPQEYYGVQIQGEGSMLLEKISFHYQSIDTLLGVECLVNANLKME